MGDHRGDPYGVPSRRPDQGRAELLLSAVFGDPLVTRTHLGDRPKSIVSASAVVPDRRRSAAGSTSVCPRWRASAEFRDDCQICLGAVWRTSLTVSPNHHLPLGPVLPGADCDGVEEFVRPVRMASSRSAAKPAGEPPHAAGVRRRPTGLPLPELVPSAGCEDVFFVSTRIDNRGRLADRSAIRGLGWQPETPVFFGVGGGALVIVSPGQGHYAITRQGYLRLPAEVRHRCRVTAGSGLLVVIPPERDRLLVYTAAAVTAALSQVDEATRRLGC